MNNPVDKSKYPFCYLGFNYALQVVGGEIPNSKYVVGACARFLGDIENKKFIFDYELAERYLRLVQNFSHVTGVWPTKNIVYSPWQNWVWMTIMGFINPKTRQRRFRTAHIEIPRGHGKSVMASQASLFFLCCDNPVGNTISCFATKKDQARIVLDSSRAMAKGNPSFLRKYNAKVLMHGITHDDSNSKIRAMSSDHNSMDGLADILSVIDELHSVDRQLFDVVSSGMSKRNDSLLLCITTAGTDITGVGYSQSYYAKKICMGDIEDDQFFSVVYCAEEGDDPFSEATWRKANPGYGVSVDPITIRAKAEKAKEVASDLPNFKIKHLNMWISEANAFFDLQKWDQCADPTLTIEKFLDKEVRIGSDLASHIDLAALGYVFYDRKLDHYYIFERSYIPEETVIRLRSSFYENCIADGELIKTKGEAIDQEMFKTQLVKDKKSFRIQDALFDPWNAIYLMQQAEKERIPTTEFRMTVANLSLPTKKLDELIRKKKISHNGSKLLRWCIGNVVCKIDANDNVFPRKNNEKLKIDPVIAILMALASYLQDVKKESVYEERGIIKL